MALFVKMPDALGRMLEAEAKKLGVSRDTVIQRAVERYLLGHEANAWPADFLAMLAEREADARLRPFESYRDELPPPKEFGL